MSPTTALVLFGLVTLLALGMEIMYTYATQGFAFGFSANRGIVERSPLALRIQRAYQNQIESAAYCVPVLAAASIAGLQSSGVQTAALLIVVGRAAFVALYYTGIPFIRIPAFGMTTLSNLFIVYSLLTMSAA